MKVMAHLTLLLVALWVGATVDAMVDLQKRIIGGTTCKPTERLYHVQLLSVNGTHESLCGGSLISDEWILTAAHCYKPGWTMTAVLGVHPGDDEEKVQITAPPVIFKDKDEDDDDRDHDIMLLKLPKPVQIQPIGLPNCRHRPKIGDKVQIAGRGSTKLDNYDRRLPGRSNTLQRADIEVVNCETLKLMMAFTSRDYQHWFCGQSPGVDLCKGDSGGGVVFKDMIYGVISFAGDDTFACSEPVAFMDVCAYKGWIKKTIAKPKKCLFSKCFSP